MSEQKSGNSNTGRGCAVFLGIIFLIAGILLAALGVKELYDSWQLANSGQPVTGTVVGYATYVDDEQATRYQAIINYQAGTKTYAYKDPDASLSPKFDVNQPVELLYMPDQPEVAAINRPVDLWINPLLPLGAGVFLTIVSIGLFWARRK